MTWFRKRAGLEKSNEPFEPVSPMDSDEVLRARISRLAGDEIEIYKWLREFYSERWIAETLLLDRCTAKEKTRRVYHKLGVSNKKALIQVYSRFERPRKGLMDTDEIDRYADARMEEEIQKKLNDQD